MEIEQVQFDGALWFFAGDGWSKTDIDKTVMQDAVKPGFDKVNTIGRELLTMRA